ncbi:succinylglutamate-semialdehyde dehydrogenase [Oscillospiraceae bacterium 42-9]
MISKGNYINGKWKLASGGCLTALSPNSGEVIWKGQNSNSKDIDECVHYATQALPSWSALPVDTRIEFLQNFVSLVKENAVKLAEAISMEVGKPLWESKTEVSAIAGKLAPSVAAYKQRCTEVIKEMPSGGVSRTQFKPIGVVAVIGPYNFPGHMANGHIIPALIAGNTVIFKPSEKGSMTAELLIELWHEAGLPSGVLSLLQGDWRTGEALISHKSVNGVFFTGSYGVGEKIRQACGSEKMCALEMGGNSPLVVWDSSNVDAAVLATIQSAFITAGQRCSSARRVIVPQNSFGEIFVKRLVEVASGITVGKYTDTPEPFYGALRTPDMVDHILAEQEQLMEMGGISLLKSERLSSIGDCFVSPGIIDITAVSQKPDNELIGPYIKIIRVTDFDEAIAEANNTSYGLAAGVFTESRNLYEKFNAQIRAGIVNWNQQLTGAVGTAPFGGIKKSGNYRPSGYFAVDYCVYAVASIEVEKLRVPSNLPQGIKGM